MIGGNDFDSPDNSIEVIRKGILQSETGWGSVSGRKVVELKMPGYK